MPQIPKPIIQERARELRVLGKARFDTFLASEIGATRSILIETQSLGRTEHFAPVKFKQHMAAGAVIRATVTGHVQDHLEARLAA